jgi:hypothetical protein
VTYAADACFTSAAPSQQRSNLAVRHVAIIILLGVAAVAAAIVAISPFPGLALRIVFEELDPTSISWDGKTAWRRCDSAIAGRTSWPQSPQGACAAMHLCANEAPLSDIQEQQLAQAIRDTPDCPEP